MTAIELQDKLQNGEKIKVYDIRNKVKFDLFHLKDAINIEKGELLSNPGKYLSKTEKSYVTCNGGNSASLIANILKSQGFNIEYLVEGMNPLLKKMKKI